MTTLKVLLLRRWTVIAVGVAAGEDADIQEAWEHKHVPELSCHVCAAPRLSCIVQGMIGSSRQAHLQHVPSHRVRLITLPLAPLLTFPDVTRFAPVVQPIPAHAVACELTGRLLVTT